jgi:hypothetical protein
MAIAHPLFQPEKKLSRYTYYLFKIKTHAQNTKSHPENRSNKTLNYSRNRLFLFTLIDVTY